MRLTVIIMQVKLDLTGNELELSLAKNMGYTGFCLQIILRHFYLILRWEGPFSFSLDPGRKGESNI